MSFRTFFWCQWVLAVMMSAWLVTPASYYLLTGSHSVETFDLTLCLPVAQKGHSSADCVRNIQEMLRHDQPHAHLPATGHFGPHTKIAVRIFQERHQLSHDGKVGPLTAFALNRYAPRPRMLSYLTSFTDTRLPTHDKILVLAVLAAIAAVLKRTGFCALLCRKPYVLTGVTGAAGMEVSHFMLEGWMPNAIAFIAVALLGTFAESLKSAVPSPAPSRWAA